ncbi:hypothetical protein MMC27_000636 [Xylographa pallens]|nr:hypothetical protein [Xylographa pallens]
MTSSTVHPIPPGIAPDYCSGDRDGILDELRNYINETTTDSHLSEDLGIQTILAGASTDDLVPVLFRCQWPANARSRHILIWLRASISDVDFGTVINDQFNVIEAGGAIQKTVATWVGFNPFDEPEGPELAGRVSANFREAVARSVGLDNPPSLQQVLTMINMSMNAIMEVHVKKLEDLLVCHFCDSPVEHVESYKKTLRTCANGLICACNDCRTQYGAQMVPMLAGVRREELRGMAGHSG